VENWRVACCRERFKNIDVNIKRCANQEVRESSYSQALQRNKRREELLLNNPLSSIEQCNIIMFTLCPFCTRCVLCGQTSRSQRTQRIHKGHNAYYPASSIQHTQINNHHLAFGYSILHIFRRVKEAELAHDGQLWYLSGY
jgi:hypothetical protein